MNSRRFTSFDPLITDDETQYIRRSRAYRSDNAAAQRTGRDEVFSGSKAVKGERADRVCSTSESRKYAALQRFSGSCHDLP
jgi:hypothetical protein